MKVCDIVETLDLFLQQLMDELLANEMEKIGARGARKKVESEEILLQETALRGYGGELQRAEGGEADG